MIKSKQFNKILSLVLSVAVVFSVFCTMVINSNAASYSSIVLDVPRISQRPNTGDCAIASISSVEAYFYSMPSGDYTSTAYQSVYAANGYSISANWYTLGYKSVSGFDMQDVYDQLNSGYPVIVHRTSSHYSVIYGYNGDSSNLQLSGFLIFDVDDSYNNTTAKKTLDKWQGKYSLDQMVFRCDGLAIPTSGLTINGNHPKPYHIQGDTFSVYGMIISRYNITNVAMSIKDSSGATAKGSTYTASPNEKSFEISNGDDNMYFSKLSTGSYTYSVVAKDSSGSTVTYSYKFNVVSNGSEIPPEDPGNNNEEPEIKYISYSATVTADPSLNLRSGAGLSYSVIASVPNGSKVNVSAECDGWGKITFNNQTGWVSLEYLEKTVEGSVYTRLTTSVYMKSEPSLLSSAVILVPEGTAVQSFEKNGVFLKINYDGKTGWVFSGFAVEGIGDLDGNGKLDSGDALAILQYVTNPIGLSSLQLQLADMNGDGKVNSLDALIVLQISVGIMKN